MPTMTIDQALMKISEGTCYTFDYLKELAYCSDATDKELLVKAWMNIELLKLMKPA